MCLKQQNQNVQERRGLTKFGLVVLLWEKPYVEFGGLCMYRNERSCWGETAGTRKKQEFVGTWKQVREKNVQSCNVLEILMMNMKDLVKRKGRSWKG